MVLAGLIAAIYAPGVGAPYVYEDLNDLPTFTRVDSTWAMVVAMGRKPFRSLTSWSYWVTHRLWPGPAGDRVGNLALHGANSVTLAVVAARVLPPVGVLGAVGLFALHPAQVESVAYVSARADLLATLGVLVALLGALTARGGLVVAGSLWAVLAKETFLLAAPGVALLWIVCRGPGRWRAWWGWLVGAALAPAAWVLAQHYGAWPSLEALGRLAAAWWRLLALLVVPVGFTVDHDWAVVPGWLGRLALLGLLGTTGWALWRRRTWGGWAWLAALLWWLPRVAVPEAEGLHEHHLYGPLVPLTLAWGASWADGEGAEARWR